MPIVACKLFLIFSVFSNYSLIFFNGTTVINITNITAGEHNITVIYSGDENHTNTTINTTIKVKQAITPIDISVADINVGDVATIVVTVNDDVTGDITIEIDGKRYTQPIVDGKATFTVENLTAGEKSVFAMYEGDEYYAPNHASESFKVSKLPSEVTATIEDTKVGDNVTITVKVPSDATGQVLIDIDGVGYYVNVTDGTGSIEIPRIPSGVYEVGLTYTGDDKYLPSVTTVKFTVSKLKTPINAAGDEIEEGEEATIVVRVPEDATGTITITVNGEKYTKEVENGKAVFVIPGLVKGDWDVQAEYSGDKKYEANDTITDILVYRNDPSGNETHNDTEGGESARAVSEGIALSKYPTGNPILMILLILIALGAGQARRFKR